jgi:pseudouridylate synthase
MKADLLRIASDVAAAVKAGKPVVALESTIITHGMPYPENVRTAREVEAVVRASGAVPATIAVFDGAVRVGLSDAELESLGQARDVMKLSRADLAFAVSARRTGSTTVAATMICAHLAGIEVFATGGIGGVHRGVEATLDISADLDEFARTPVAVVCAGAKALLDLPRTLEYLETRGVPVVCYRSDEFPAFWSRNSGLAAPLRLDQPADIAAFMRARKGLGIDGGLVVANPIPANAEIPAAEIESLVRQAIREADGKGITGKAVTPYLLGRMLKLSGGRSLPANIALVKNNAALAAQIAGALRA